MPLEIESKINTLSDVENCDGLG